MTTEQKKKLLTLILQYSHRTDGVFYNHQIVDQYFVQAESEYTNNRLVKVSCSATDRASYSQQQFVITQEEIDELLSNIDRIPKMDYPEEYCVHSWKVYEGVVHKDYYCVNCNAKRPWTWEDKI